MGWLSIGPEPGDGPAGEAVVMGAAAIAFAVGLVVCARAASRERPTLPVLLIPASAAVFMVARFYTYDPYYAPTLRRMSDDGAVPASWVYLLAGLALLVTLTARAHARVGMISAAMVVLLCGLTSLWEGSGH